MPIDLLPSYGTPPNTSDPDNFDARADAKVAADVVFVEQMNADTIPGINAAVVAVNAAMDAGLANAATNAATAATKAGEASTSAADALAYRNAAQGFRNEAEYWAGVAEEASGIPNPTDPGKFLAVNATGDGWELKAAGLRMVTEYLTSGTTWTAPANLVGGRVKYRMVGGGAGGGIGATTSLGNIGGPGGYCEGVASVTPGSPYTYAIGAGGASVPSGAAAAGTAGGNTTMFGATAGGAPAPASGAQATGTSGVAGGAATGGGINVGDAFRLNTSAAQGFIVGNTPFGINGVNAQSVGAAASGYGVGGTGGTAAAVASGAGMPGLIVLDYLVSI
ncbi:hypothetical protein [Xenophilus sp. Marseille-Q4582]|uniref:glycine-rich domain-containing protein n=1 Tax=Xenophilus sp. Marseille-Q4582 TaxID=2866600 RepID=UPI001CE46587|nr:hypothetical protein [Xenophilus sp. Marseille-Q4582]